MTYTTITHKIMALIREADPILQQIDRNRGSNGAEIMTIYSTINKSINDWAAKISAELLENDLELEDLQIRNIINPRRITVISFQDQFDFEKDMVIRTKDALLAICFRLESKSDKKTINTIFIDDIDNFKPIVASIKPGDVDQKYIRSAFLEDDVENAFLNIIKEPYKESDSGAETRDLYTDKITIGGKRHSCVIMFKGRGVSGPLKISDCGKNGDQLLKLAKNSFTQLYIVQHVNKIEPEVREALRDHIAAHSNASDIKICLVDGSETVRILKGLGMNLDELIKKKSKSGRKDSKQN